MPSMIRRANTIEEIGIPYYSLSFASCLVPVISFFANWTPYYASNANSCVSRSYTTSLSCRSGFYPFLSNRSASFGTIPKIFTR